MTFKNPPVTPAADVATDVRNIYVVYAMIIRQFAGSIKLGTADSRNICY